MSPVAYVKLTVGVSYEDGAAPPLDGVVSSLVGAVAAIHEDHKSRGSEVAPPGEVCFVGVKRVETIIDPDADGKEFFPYAFGKGE